MGWAQTNMTSVPRGPLNELCVLRDVSTAPPWALQPKLWKQILRLLTLQGCCEEQ